MKSTIIYNGNDETKLTSYIVTRGSFKNKGEFVTFCSRNKINGDYSLLWELFAFKYSITLYRPYTNETPKWED